MGNECMIRVRGRLSPDVLAALHPLRPVVLGPETELRGVVVDQAALHGIIARLESLAVELVAPPAATGQSGRGVGEGVSSTRTRSRP